MKKLLYLALPLIASLCYSAPQAVGPIGFGKGVNFQKSVTDIDDQQSPDMCNCISNQDGSASKIWGTKRFITQAYSSQPVSGLYHAQASSGTISRDILLAIIGKDVVVATGIANPLWVSVATVTPGQNWSFVTMNNKVIFTGDGLVDDIKSYDIFASTVSDVFGGAVLTGTESIKIRAKYLAFKSNYLLYVNCSDISAGTTYYNSRVYFSLLNNQSSTTYNRFFDVRTNDGEELTGVGVNYDKVNLFKNSSIHELSFSILDLKSRGGDQSLAEVVSGFGLVAPRTLQTDGIYYIIASQDSIRIWDGGRRSRLTPGDESNPITEDIKPLMDKLIKSKTYQRMVGKIYKKRNWYVLSYEDPEKFPEGKNNSVIIYDLALKQWYPICGWNASSFETLDGLGNDGSLLYGDSTDGFAYYADIETESDNAPKNIVIDPMDSTSTWVSNPANRMSREYNDIKEGTGSIKVWTSNLFKVSSATIMKVLPLGSWNDKSEVLRTDKLTFKFKTSSTESITKLRIDLEVNDDSLSGFDTNFTSHTITDFSIYKSSSWYTMEIPLSSFSVRPDWTSYETELVPFAGTLNFYGLRFVFEGVGVATTTIDDVRVVQNRNPVNFYRFTKLYNFGSLMTKTGGQILLTMDKPRDSTLSMDIYNDFGNKINTAKYEADIPKEIMVMGWMSTASIAVIDDIDYTVLKSTQFNESFLLPLNGVATKDYIFFSDRTNDRIVKMERNPNFGTLKSTAGTFGSGNSNFNMVHQMDVNEKGSIYMVDMYNQRVKEHSQKDLSFIRSVGSLGSKATSYHQATGITANDEKVVVSDEGNYRLTQLNVSTMGVMLQKLVDFNTIGDSSLEEDSEFIYLCYNKVNPTSGLYQDVILEKRFRGNLDLVTRTTITPKDSVSLSTYALQGDIALRGRYIYVSFTSDSLGINPVFYVQKRLKSDFSLVNEHIHGREIFSILGDAFAYKPSLKNEYKNMNVEGKYIQIKFYDEGNDNYVRLLNQTFLMEPQQNRYEGAGQ